MEILLSWFWYTEDVYLKMEQQLFFFIDYNLTFAPAEFKPAPENDRLTIQDFSYWKK
jgi:hypothetical protein